MPIVLNDVKNTLHRMMVFYEQSLYCHLNNFEICSQRLRLTGIDTCSTILILKLLFLYIHLILMNVTGDQTHVRFSHTKKIAKRKCFSLLFCDRKEC